MPQARTRIRDVIVTAREVRRLFSKSNEAAVNRAAQSEGAKRGQDPWLMAARLAALGTAQREIEAAYENEDPEILVASRNQMASILQSYLAKQAAEAGHVQPLLSGGKEIKFEDGVTGMDPEWTKTLFGYLGLMKKHDPKPPTDARADYIPSEARIALLGDWGTGLYGAPACANAIEGDKPFALLMHLGDVYYSGTPEEVQERFLDLWPVRPEAVSRALNGNHEMYSGGTGYFEFILRAFKQPASYFVFQNENWTLIGLDTGYEDGAIDEQQTAWLEEVIRGAEGRKVILFSHHFLYSLFEDTNVALGHRLKALLEAKRILAWYWGHEHRCVLFDQHPRYGLFARCVGHSGIPHRRDKIQNAPKAGAGMGWSWCRLPANPGPSALVLDGINPYVPGKEDRYAPNGYMVLELRGNELYETVHTPSGEVIWGPRQPSPL